MTGRKTRVAAMLGATPIVLGAQASTRDKPHAESLLSAVETVRANKWRRRGGGARAAAGTGRRQGDHTSVRRYRKRGGTMPTSWKRIPVTQDPELSEALQVVRERRISKDAIEQLLAFSTEPGDLVDWDVLEQIEELAWEE